MRPTILPSDPAQVCRLTSDVTSSRKPLVVLPVRGDLCSFHCPQYLHLLIAHSTSAFSIAFGLFLSYLLHTRPAFDFLGMPGAVPHTDKYLLDLKLIFSHSREGFTLKKIYDKEKGSLDFNVFPKFHQLIFFFYQFLTDRAELQKWEHSFSNCHVACLQRGFWVWTYQFKTVNWTWSCSTSTQHSCCATPKMESWGWCRQRRYDQKSVLALSGHSVFTQTYYPYRGMRWDQGKVSWCVSVSFSSPTLHSYNVLEKGYCYLECWHLQRV